jgi:hypothetical protein
MGKEVRAKVVRKQMAGLLFALGQMKEDLRLREEASLLTPLV